MYFSSWRFSVVGGNYYRGLLCGSTRKQTSGRKRNNINENGTYRTNRNNSRLYRKQIK